MKPGEIIDVLSKWELDDISNSEDVDKTIEAIDSLSKIKDLNWLKEIEDSSDLFSFTINKILNYCEEVWQEETGFFELSQENYFRLVNVVVDNFTFFEQKGCEIPDSFFEEKFRMISDGSSDLALVEEKVIRKLALKLDGEEGREAMILHQLKHNMNKNEGLLRKEEKEMLSELDLHIPKFENRISFKKNLLIFKRLYLANSFSEIKGNLRINFCNFLEEFERILKIKVAPELKSKYAQRIEFISNKIESKRYLCSKHYSTQIKLYFQILHGLDLEKTHPEYKMEYDAYLSLITIYNLVILLLDYPKWGENDQIPTRTRN